MLFICSRHKGTLSPSFLPQSSVEVLLITLDRVGLGHFESSELLLDVSVAAARVCRCLKTAVTRLESVKIFAAVQGRLEHG